MTSLRVGHFVLVTGFRKTDYFGDDCKVAVRQNVRLTRQPVQRNSGAGKEENMQLPEISILHELRWPPNTPRTRILDRRGNAHWKQDREKYNGVIITELTRMGAHTILFSTAENERVDPAASIWFGMQRQEYDYSWQDGLELDNPGPTLKEIDDAYRKMAAKCHPDRADGGNVELFKQLAVHRRDARSWVLGTRDELALCCPCDNFNETSLNLAALSFALAAFRRLDSVGIPGILDRTLARTFSALPENTSAA
jgi:hypothetical protein